MAKCYSYHYEFGKGRCYGTKEIEYCSCEGDEARCNFYPGKRKEAGGRARITDIFTLMQALLKTGYKISFFPDKNFTGAVRIQLDDPTTDTRIDIIMRADQNYFKDPNGTVFETIDKMIEDLEELYRDESR